MIIGPVLGKESRGAADFDDKQGCLCYLSLTVFGWVEIVEFGCGMDK